MQNRRRGSGYYVMLRDHCTFKEAAISLGCWDEAPTPETARRMEAQARERDRKLAAEESRQAEERRQRLAVRDELLTASQIWRRACDRLGELRKGAIASFDGEEEACWATLALVLPDLRDSEKRYCAAAGLDSPE
jgi:hypothetical protein